MNFFLEGQEELPPTQPMAKRPKVKITCMVNSDHAQDNTTCQSVTGIILFLNNTPVRWISKRQTTVDTSTYGSELVVFRMATDLVAKY